MDTETAVETVAKRLSELPRCEHGKVNCLECMDRVIRQRTNNDPVAQTDRAAAS